jgi:CubicO group peptidase (beta-lactamase class C family)
MNSCSTAHAARWTCHERAARGAGTGVPCASRPCVSRQWDDMSRLGMIAALLGGAIGMLGAEAVAGQALAPATADAIDALMADYAGAVPGAALLVVREGEVVFRKGYGLADVEHAVAVTPASNFRLASISKQFTATTILLLAEDGALSLHDPVRRWLPSLPPATDAITLHQLLTHTSGLVDYEDVLPDAIDRPLRDADVLRLLETQDRLLFAPGSGYHYSNSGYALLALVAAKASGMDYATLLQTRIFQPLGMTATLAFENGRSRVEHRAYGYSLVDGRWTRTDQSMTSAVLGDGGVYSSIDDLATWDAALRDDRLLGAASRALAFQPHAETDEADVDGYGYGWRIHDDAGRLLLWHSGESIGFRNVILRWPQSRTTLVLLSNRNAPEPYALARRIAALVEQGPAR